MAFSGIYHLRLGTKTACNTRRASAYVYFEDFGTDEKQCLKCKAVYDRMVAKQAAKAERERTA
jgi:hypothetical protein